MSTSQVIPRLTIAVLIGALLGSCWFVHVSEAQTPRTDLPLSASARSELLTAIAAIDHGSLRQDAGEARSLLKQGIWREASASDFFLKQAESAGDTPYAYTLSKGHHPDAIVLGPRFFDAGTTPTARAALMIHEMGHYNAYVRSGSSDEYDGYKSEYDAASRLGLTERDGLVYFGMLDGVEQFVVPRDPSYARKPDVMDYIRQSNDR